MGKGVRLSLPQLESILCTTLQTLTYASALVYHGTKSSFLTTTSHAITHKFTFNLCESILISKRTNWLRYRAIVRSSPSFPTQTFTRRAPGARTWYYRFLDQDVILDARLYAPQLLQPMQWCDTSGPAALTRRRSLFCRDSQVLIRIKLCTQSF